MPFSYQQFSDGQVFESDHINQTEDSIKDHDHTGGAGGVLGFPLLAKSSIPLEMLPNSTFNVMSFQIPADTLGVDGKVRLTINFRVNTWVAGGDALLGWTTVLKYGSTSLITGHTNSLISGAVPSWLTLLADIESVNSSTTEQEGRIRFAAGTGSGAGICSFSDGNNTRGGVSSEDSTAALGMSVTVAMPSHASARQIEMRSWHLENLGD